MIFFSRQEILQHNKKQDCWIIVRNSVYDITSFIASHPGGSDILLSRAGEDATSYFMIRHSRSATVLQHLEQLKIGELPQGERITANDFDEPFLMELIDRCYADKLYLRSTWWKNPVFWSRAISILIFFLLSYIAIYMHAPWYLAMSAVAVQAIISTSLFGFVAHEHTHRDFPQNKILRILLRFSWPIFWPFISQNPLRYEHNSHHIKIGDPEFDYEVAAFAPLMRYSGHIEHAPVHQYQHIIATFMYPFYANIITTLGGIQSDFWKRHNRSVALEHVLSVSATLLYFIIVPAMLFGSAGWYILLYLIYQCVLFYGIYIGAAINHFVPSVAAEISAEHQNKYGYYVCQNTTNFSGGNMLWYWYTGGFNLQIEHHLIPFVPVEKLHKMVPIVRELCEKYNYPYHSYPSFMMMWNDHYRYLAALARPGSGIDIDTEIINKRGYQGR